MVKYNNMKYIFFISLLFALNSFSQDSSQRLLSVTLQARDAAYITSLNVGNESFEPIYDDLKKKLRVANSPTGVTPVTIDSGLVINYIRVYQALLSTSYSQAAYLFTRVSTALRNTGDAYLIRKLDELDNEAQTSYNARVNEGYRRLRGARQIMQVRRRTNR